MATQGPKCLRCGAPLSRGAIAGHCTRCLGGAAFGEPSGPESTGWTPLSAGHSLGRYELLEEIGRGGMGIVYRARQAGLERDIALKVLLQGPYAGEEEVERFRREAKAAARLRHPNIVAVFEEGDEDGHAYFSMELVPGRTLAQIVREGPLEAGRAARYAVGIARGVACAHASGILHRDIKPANVIIDGDDQPRITDFGLARRLDRQEVTVTQSVLGSPGYMPPEQADPRRGAPTVRSDVYSLGALLYELLTGRPPFAGATVALTLAQVLGDEPAPPRRLNSSVPLDLETICLKCLEKNPGQRYASALELAEDLERYLARRPIMARPIGAGERLWRWCQRQPLLAALSGGVLLLLMLLAVGSFVAALHIGSARDAERAERERAVETGRQLASSNERLMETVRVLELQRVEDLLSAGDSSTALAHLADIVRRDPSNHIAASRLVSALVNRDNAILAVAPFETGGRVTDMDIKRDGVSLLTATARGVAQLWYVPSGHEIGPAMKHDSSITVARFSRDGRLIVTGTQDGTIGLWDGVNSGRLPGQPRHDAAITDLDMDESGKLLVTGSEDRTARVWRLPEGQLLNVVTGLHSKVTIVRFSPRGNAVLVASGNGGLRMLQLEPEKLLWSRGVHRAEVTAAAFGPGGGILLTASRDGTARLLDAETGSELTAQPLRHPDWVWSARFDRSGKRIVTSCQDGLVRFWDAQDGRPEGKPLKHEGAVRDAVPCPWDNRIATASLDVTARLWDMDSGEMLRQPLWHEEMVTKALFAWGGQRLVTASSGTKVYVWDIRTRRQKLVTTLETNHVHTLDVAPDGKSFAVATQQGWVWRCDVETGQPLNPPLLLDAHATGVAYSPDGKWLAVAGGRRHEVQVWENSSGQPRYTVLPSHSNVIRNVHFNSHGDRLLTHSMDGTARVWDAASGIALTPSLRHDSDVVFAEFSPDSRLVVTASEDRTARVWDAATGLPVTAPLRHLDNLKQAEFSPDSGRVVTASTDNHACIWDARTGARLADLPHPRTVTRALFSPDGRQIATASLDRKARLWDASSGQVLTPPMAHEHFVTEARFSPDGRRLVTSDVAGRVRLWDVKTGRPLTEPIWWGRAAEAYLPRFTADGRFVVVAKAGAGVGIWQVPSTPVPVPAWFAGFAENIAGLRVGVQEHTELVARIPSSELVDLPELIPGQGYYAELARWLVGEPRHRRPSPIELGEARLTPDLNAPLGLPAVSGGSGPGKSLLRSAVWTGHEMLLWGGFGSTNVADGWAFHPGSNAWTSIGPAPGSLSPRYGHSAIWTGQEMLVWGGEGEGRRHLADGAGYDPRTRHWRRLASGGSPGALSVRAWHSAVWTGHEMIVWGGEGAGGRLLADGARYNPRTDTWAAIPASLPNTPPARMQHGAVWTGREMIVWGGFRDGVGLQDGARYDPMANEWTPISKGLPHTPAPRFACAMVWTGREILVWGGVDHNILRGDGGRYDPVQNLWRPLSGTDSPTGRYSVTPWWVWTGTEMIVWGGCDCEGGRYRPDLDRWLPMAAGGPENRSAHSMVWSGKEVLLWAGGDGARYDPEKDVWAPIPDGGEAEAARR